MGQWSRFLIQFFNISITCATQKRRGLPNTELHICTIHFFFFYNIRDNRPFCCRRWWFPVNCVRTILNQKVKTLKFYTKVHLRVNECKTFTWQNGFQFLVFSFFFPMMPPQRLPAWAESNGTQRSNKRSTLGTRQEGRGPTLVATVPETDLKTVFSPNGTDSHREKVKTKIKYAEITKHREFFFSIFFFFFFFPVISRLQGAVNINNRNVQVESVGWRFPKRSRSHAGASRFCSRAKQRK